MKKIITIVSFVLAVDHFILDGELVLKQARRLFDS